MALESTIVNHDPVTAIITFKGRLTLGSALSLADSQITKLLQDGVRKVVIDLSGVEYSDSAGLGLVINTYARLSKLGGQLRVVQPGRLMLEVLKLTRTDELLRIQPDIPTALASLNA